MKTPNDELFSPELWQPALEKYARATHVTIKLFDTGLRIVLGPVHLTPLFQLFDGGGYDPGLFVQCACRCMAQTQERPPVMVSKVHGLAVIGTSLVVDGKIIGAAVAGYVLLDFAQLSEVRRIAKDAHIDFARLWQVAREQSPVSQRRLTLNGELLQALGDAVLRENSRTRQYEKAALELRQTVAALRTNEERLSKELSSAQHLQLASSLLIEGGDSHDLYQGIVDAARAIMRSDMASMHLLPERGRGADLRLLAFHGFDPDVPKFWEQVPTDSASSWGAALMSGVRVVVPNVEKCDFMVGTGDQATYLRAGIHAVQSTPLLSRSGHLLGMISTHWRTPHTPAEDELRQFDLLARQAADLLEREQTQTTLRESESRYRTLFNLGPVGVYSCEASGAIRDFNRRAVELWGREPIPGETDEHWCGSFKLFRPDGALLPHEQGPMAEVLSGKMPEARDQEVQIERPDGSRITVIVNIRPLKNEREEIVGAINCFVDITERKQVEEVRSRLAAIVEFSDDAMISKTIDGTIMSWNRGAERLFGYAAEEAIGQNITILVPPDRLNEESMILDRLGRGERVEHLETLRMCKDGKMLDISLTISPITNASGRVISASEVARDITERKRTEHALRDAHDHLEALVALRTAAVRKLSTEMIRSQDEERRRISRELHDSVGQHLAHAKMNLEGLRKATATEKEAKILRQVADTLDQCLTETRTISYLLHPPLLDEVGFASAASWYVEGFSERSNIQVNSDIPRELGRLPAAIELVLFRILQESLTNVHRHARSASVDLRVRADASEIGLEIRDHGQGMQAEVLERFKRNGGGGVGLNSMRERVGELGGRFEIESDANGTLIRVAIPLSIPHMAKAKGNSA